MGLFDDSFGEGEFEESMGGDDDVRGVERSGTVGT